ncbi:MAG: hypothetical protein HGA60_10695, partial [Chlorobiaceae bacterium]|nr:hypothetical protein [Chlorobiaceae bacterium]
VIGFASTRFFGQVLKPLANTLRNANSDHLVSFFFFHIPSLYMLYIAIHVRQKQRYNQNRSLSASVSCFRHPGKNSGTLFIKTNTQQRSRF